MTTPRCPNLACLLGLLLLPVPLAVATAWWHPRAPASQAPAEATAASSYADFRARHPNALWLDARSPVAFARSHLVGALNLAEDDWERGFHALVERWDGARPLVVYCDDALCHASEKVATRLRTELGADARIVVFKPGVRALPVTPSDAAP
jgi:rhodanese-related sulfurtransferase